MAILHRRTRQARSDPFAKRRLTPLQVLLAVFLVALMVSVEFLLWRGYVTAGERSASFKRSSLTVTNLANVQRESTRLYAESLRIAEGETNLDDLELQRMLVGRQLHITDSWGVPADELARMQDVLDRYDSHARYLFRGFESGRSVTVHRLSETAGELERVVKATYDRHEQRFLAQLTSELRREAASQQAMLLLGIVVMVIAAALTLLLRRSVRTDFQRAYDALLHEVREREAVQGQLEHQAYHDALTGLANRALFIKRVQEAVQGQRRTDETIGVIFIDLDDFKNVNDTLGHEAGDALLIEAAKRLGLCLRGEDVAARLGGDEFAVLFEHSSDAERVAERILDALRAPMRIADRELVVTASVGIAIGGPEIEYASTILANADIAMYSAKSQGKSQYALFAVTMQEEAQQRLRIQADMQQALQDGEFVLHYQPIIDLRTRQSIGAEALIRWNHREFGLVSPVNFIPIAEETGFIRELGRLVLDEATAKAAAWQKHVRRPLSISVNVSARQVQDAGMVSDVERALTRSALPPDLLVLEITESVLMLDREVAVNNLRQLRSIGVHIALDDFGTGYSSLSYLRQLPVDTLKIDKSFIDCLEDGPEESAVARAVIEFGTSVGLRTVAEGIETAGELQLLIQLGCQYGQGYLLSRPLDDVAIDQFFADESRQRTSWPGSVDAELQVPAKAPEVAAQTTTQG
jgi:diguanylate cyclase (GGDEF)-like protein